jgi:predicted amino acid-binding ACT domain protein
MKRAISLISLSVLSGLLAMSFIVSAQAQTKAKPKKEVILTTTDIKDSYKVIGIVSVKTGETNLDTLNDKLKEEAKGLGADYVIGVNYFYVQGGYLYAYGTAVKIKE